MKEKMIKGILEELCKNLPKEEKEKFKELNIENKFIDYMSNEIKDLDEDECRYYLNNLKSSVEQIDSEIKEMDSKYVDMFCDNKNYIINLDERKDIYSLDDLLKSCSIKQLDLYHTFYSYSFNVFDVEKINNKKILIGIVKEDIILNFKSYVKRSKKSEIEFYKTILKNNGVVDEVIENFISFGYFIPFKLCKGKKVRYIMAKELMDIIKEADFSKTSEDTKKTVSELLDYLVISKGVVSKYEVEKFILDSADMNIKKDEIWEIVEKTFIKKDGYYYNDKVIDSNLFNELVEIKKKNPYLPSYEEILEFEIIVNDLINLLMGIVGPELKFRIILKDLFYEPIDCDKLINKICKKLKINKQDKNLLEEFIYNNVIYFHYWVNNGKQNYSSDYLDWVDELLDEEDLPF